MFDERAFIARLEAADVNELAQIVLRPTRDEERALRVHLGDACYERQHNLALKRSFVRGARGTRGNVVVIHGIMGSELSTFNRKGTEDQVWAKVVRLISGCIDRLRLSDDGKGEYNEQYDVRATGIMKRYYGELLLAVARNWNVRAFWFDWRKDLRLAAKSLDAHISNWFPDTAPVHIVAHSMGGLVARTFIEMFPERWELMLDRRADGRAGGRLIMLGTPNHGSFAVPQIMTGLEGLVRKLALIDMRHNLADLQAILNSFVGSYQMLPSPFVMKTMEPLYKAQTYGDDLKISQRHLDYARSCHEKLSKVVHPDRMVYVAGYNQPTFSNIKNLSNLRSLDSYEVTMEGDGRVPHALGFLELSGGRKVKNYFIQEGHGDLTTSEIVFDSIDELLEGGSTTRLPDELPPLRAVRGGLRPEDEVVTSEKIDEALLLSILPSLKIRSARLNYIATDERKVEEILTKGFLGHKESPMSLSNWSAKDTTEPVAAQNRQSKKAAIEVRLTYGRIENVDGQTGDLAVDAIAVGHYLGVKPQYAELALDRAISQALPANKKISPKDLSEPDLILTQYTQRGTLRGELGQPFFLSDPRTSNSNNGRVIAVAGMGAPARFGEPQLVVLARELCWSLGVMGKRHLATVLIGAGQGNLTTHQAISGWMHGIKKALDGSDAAEDRYLRRITFVEYDPAKIEEIELAILSEQKRLGSNDRFAINYEPFGDQDLSGFRNMVLQTRYKQMKKEMKEQKKSGWATKSKSKEKIATTITVEFDGDTYRYGAITKNASIPVREVQLDPALVEEANQILASQHDSDLQADRGKFVGKLLLPDDLRDSFYSNAPVVMMLDATTARIHWEMVALPNREAGLDTTEFLGRGQGFTRQLRTTFAPPPEPPPPPRRVLRVLVVADPAEDAPLVGAQQEGFEVTDLFNKFNEVYGGQENAIEVKALIGPQKANRIDVLRELINHSYDVLHFAGHCVYDEKDPSGSGWIFTNGQLLTAKELNRIDRIPRFVFSNACESGITPDRSDKRSVDLAPSFAESFFKQGVADFVCTAWPVEDTPARMFALRLYAGLLGLTEYPAASALADAPEADSSESVLQKSYSKRGDFESMHEAMRQAREEIGIYGGLTWGAYQHYGNPYFSLFDTVTMERDRKQRNDENRKIRPAPKGAGAKAVSKMKTKR